MLRLLMRLIPIVLGLAAAGAAWFVTQPGGLFSLGNSPRRSGALAGIAFLIVFVLTWLPGFVFERVRRKREAAEAALPEIDTPMSFGPLPPIRPSAVTDARTPYVPQFADDDEPDAAPEATFAPAAPTRAEGAAPAADTGSAFAWPTMTAAELGQPEPAAEDVPPSPAPVAAPAPAAAADAPIDELLMRRKADLAAALQRVSSAAQQPAAAPSVEAAPVDAATSPTPVPEDAPEPAPAPAASAPSAIVTPMPAHRPSANPRPAAPLPDMRARIAAIRRELD
jgi:hypothetical protein